MSSAVTKQDAPRPEATQSGIAPQKPDAGIQVRNLELPKGGGALKGIGETFQTNAFSGTSSAAFPVPASPCRDFAPQLHVQYASGSGNSPFGLGMSLSVPAISRQTNKGTPRYDGTDDGFVLFGGEYLVALTGASSTCQVGETAYTVQPYAPRVRHDFSRIEFWYPEGHPVSQNSFWKMTTEEHVIHIFGKNAHAQIADPDNPDHVFRWLLEESYNAKGDHQLYTYQAENQQHIPSAVSEHNRLVGANRYLSHLCYGNDQPIFGSIVLAETPPASPEWHFELVFDYGQYDLSPQNPDPYQPQGDWACRVDPFSSYEAGFEIRTYRLCHHSMLFHRFAELNSGKPTLVAATAYQYRQNQAHISCLEAVVQTGYQWNAQTQSYDSAAYPPVTLGYTGFQPEGHDFETLSTASGERLIGLNEAPQFNLVDLFGEGVPGILYADASAPRYKEVAWQAGKPAASAQPPEANAPIAKLEGQVAYENTWDLLDSFPIPREVQKSDLNLMDVTGNGQLDLLLASPGMQGYWEAKSDQRWGAFTTFETFPEAFPDQNQTWADLTGDGVSDLIQIVGKTIWVYPSLREKGFGKATVETLPESMPTALESAPQVSIHMADMAGSGQPAMVRIEAGQVSYWPSLGYGRFGEAVHMQNPPDLPEDFLSSRLFLADIDGSGTTDLLYATNTELWYYPNYSGNAFGKKIAIPFPEPIGPLDQISFADVYGRGTACLVISRPAGSPDQPLTPKHLCYDFCQQTKPYLLNHLQNNLGATTRITYGSSVDFYLADKQQGLPWITNIPFPVHVVTQIEHHDAISGSRYQSEYRYHHGYYDGREREFRGFGRVDRQDCEYFPPSPTAMDDPHYVTPALSLTWYDVGCDERRDELLAQYRKEYYQGDASAFHLPPSRVTCDDPASRAQIGMALTGSELRTELYAADSHTSKFDQAIEQLTGIHKDRSCPYVVSESNVHVELLQPKGDQAYAVFRVHPEESLTQSYEQDPADPQTHHELVLHVDAYGHVEQTAAIAYPRREGAQDRLPAQASTRITASIQTYVNQADDPDQYVLGVPAESRVYEITGLEAPSDRAFTWAEVKDYVEAALKPLSPQQPESAQARVMGWQRWLYAEVDAGHTAILPLNQVKLPLLLGAQHTAEWTPDQLHEGFQGVLEGQALSQKLAEGLYIQDPDSDYWWNPGLQQTFYGADHFYLPQATLVPTGSGAYGHPTHYTYDSYHVLLTQVTNALGNSTTSTALSYQHLQSEQVVDQNDRTSAVHFDPLGHVTYTSVYGYEAGQEKGFVSLDKAPSAQPTNLQDLIDHPETYLGGCQSYFYYDFFAWKDRGQPIYAASLVAENYPQDVVPSSSAEDLPPIQIHLSYQDGLGRELQSKARVEGGDSFVYDASTQDVRHGTSESRWLTSGGKVYNNKGDVVKAYEPYYINTFEYVTNPVLDTFGVSPTLYYDPLGRQYKTITAKGFVTLHAWTTWKELSFDNNDLLKLSPYYQANIAQPDSHSPFYDTNLTEAGKRNIEYVLKYFHNTPTTVTMDNLGHAIVTTQVNQKPSNLDQPLDSSSTVVQQILNTHTTYDILGRPLTTSDPRLSQHQIDNFSMIYGISSTEPLRTISADAGTDWKLANSLGHPFFSYDSRNIQVNTYYDVLQRPLKIDVRTNHHPDSDPLVLNQVTQYVVYGDNPGIDVPEKCNLKGEVYIHYDEAGKTEISGYALTGHPTQTQRAFRTEYQQEANWSAFDDSKLSLKQALTQVDQLLQNEAYSSVASYDALGRVIEETDPSQNKLQPNYYRSGLLKVLLATPNGEHESHAYVSHIQYNAKGQRLSFDYGNQTSTTYQYDPKNFFPIRIATTDSQQKTIQDLTYQYDPAGNVFQKESLAEANKYYNNQKISPVAANMYDALYQLIQGSGREKVGKGQQADPHADIQPTMPGENDFEALQNYMERYTYDQGGNLVETRHIAANNHWTSKMVVSHQSNRAVISTIKGKTAGSEPKPEEVDRYFDAQGNQIRMQALHPLVWDYRNQLQAVTTVQHEDGTRDGEYYVYDATGQRVRKITEQYAQQGEMVQLKETVYLGHLEIRRTLKGRDLGSAQVTHEYQSLRLMDGDQAVATRDQWTVGEPLSGFHNPAILYHLSDALGSCTIQLDDQGAVVSQEEYSPYGQSTLFFGTGSAYLLTHYRYSGKERDSVTGLYYYGARYYANWNGRWLNPDPAGTVDGLNLYLFVKGNPVTFRELNGNDSTHCGSPEHDASNIPEENNENSKATLKFVYEDTYSIDDTDYYEFPLNFNDEKNKEKLDKFNIEDVTSLFNIKNRIGSGKYGTVYKSNDGKKIMKIYDGENSKDLFSWDHDKNILYTESIVRILKDVSDINPYMATYNDDKSTYVVLVADYISNDMISEIDWTNTDERKSLSNEKRLVLLDTLLDFFNDLLSKGRAMQDINTDNILISKDFKKVFLLDVDHLVRIDGGASPRNKGIFLEESYMKLGNAGKIRFKDAITILSAERESVINNMSPSEHLR